MDKLIKKIKRINKMITLQVESKVKTMIDKRLVELGLIKV